MVVDALDVLPLARRRVEDVAHELEIDLVVRARILRRIHQLHRQVDALGRRVGALDGEDVLLAQDRNVALDEEPRALVVVGDHAFAENDALTRLELNLERHGILPDWRTGARSWADVVNGRLTLANSE